MAVISVHSLVFPFISNRLNPLGRNISNLLQSLWSMNDRFSSTALIIAIIVVASTTYVTVLNINSLVHAISHIYDTRKSRVVKAMKSNRDETWKQRGQRFETFRPKHENPQPSEWYIILYSFLNPWVLLGFRRRKEHQEQEEAKIRRTLQARNYLGLPILFRRRPKARESESDGEGWVL